MTYSEDEIRTAVSSVLRTTVRRPLDSLGVRKIEVTYSDMQEAAAGLFLLDQTAPFYVTYLAIQKLLVLLYAEADLLDELIAAARVVGRNIVPIDNTTPLYNAKAAMFDLGSAVAGGTKTLKAVTSLPAYIRFEANVDKFLSDYGSTIKEAGEIVDTPRGAKNFLRANLGALQTSHALLITKLSYILNALSDFSALSLPSQVGSSVVTKSRELVTRITTAMENATPGGRQEIMRDSVLGLLTAKAAIKSIGTFTAPAEFYEVSGSATLYSDSSHLAEPATVVSDIAAPYGVQSALSLDIAVDGNAPVNVPLSTAVYPRAEGLATDKMEFAASVLGTRTGPFEFLTFTNNKFRAFFFDPATREYLPITLSTWNGSVTIGTVVTDVNTAIAGIGLGAYYAAQNTGGALELYSLGVGDDYRICVGDGTANFVLGFSPTGGLYIEKQLAAKLVSRRRENFNTVGNEAFEIFLQHPNANKPVRLTFSVTSGAAVTAATIAADIQAAIVAAGLQNFYQSVASSGLVIISAIAPLTAKHTMSVGSGALNNVLGWDAGEFIATTEDKHQLIVEVPGLGGSPFTILLDGGRQTAREISTTIDTALPASFDVGIAGAEDQRSVYIAYVGMTPNAFQATMRFPADSNPAALALIFLTTSPYRGRTLTASLVAKDISNKLDAFVTTTTSITPVTGGSSATASGDITDATKVVIYRLRSSATVTSPAANTIRVSGVSLTNVAVGNILVVRDGVNANSKWTITAVSATYFDATGVFTPVGGSCSIDVGYNFSATPGYSIRIEDSIAKGTYEVTTVAPGALAVPFEFLVSAALPGYSSVTPLTFTATLGQEYLVVSSKNKTISSALSIDGTAASLFYSTVPAVAVASTPWVSLPSKVRGVQRGDTLHFYDTNGLSPAFTCTVTSVAGTLLGLSPSIAVGTPTNFYEDTLPPFIRMGNGLHAQYAALVSSVSGMGIDEYTAYFKELARLANIVLVQPNPTLGQVNDLVSQFQALRYVLVESGSPNPSGTLEHYLKAYVVDPNNDIDEMLRGFVEKGAKRAVDILTEGRFQEFFGMTSEEVSYSGALVSSLRNVAQNDLPVRKTKRVEAYRSKVESSTNSPDYEYDTTDTELSTIPETPSTMEQSDVGENPADL